MKSGIQRSTATRVIRPDGHRPHSQRRGTRLGIRAELIRRRLNARGLP